MKAQILYVISSVILLLGGGCPILAQADVIGGYVEYENAFVTGSMANVRYVTYVDQSEPISNSLMLIDGDSASLDTIQDLCFGVQKRTYVGQKVFPGPFNYQIGFLAEPRSGIVNHTMYINKEVPISTWVYLSPFEEFNNSIQLLADPVFQAVQGQPFRQSIPIIDPDGDDIFFLLYSDWDDHVYPDGLEMNYHSGELTWDAPTELGWYHIRVLVTEVRDGSSVNQSYIDYLLEVVPDPGAVSSGFSGLENWPQSDGWYQATIVPELGESISLDLSFGGQSNAVQLQAFGSAFQGSNPATFQGVNSGDSAHYTFNWTPDTSQIRGPFPYKFYFQGIDSCEDARVGLTVFVSMPVSAASPSPVDESWNVFPNPATNQLTIDFSVERDLPVQVELLDVQGRRVMQEVITQTQQNLDVSGLTPGLYLLRSGSDQRTVRVVVR